MDEKLIDHKDVEKLFVEIMEGQGNRIACNVLPMLKRILEILEEYKSRIEILEGMLDV